jgi:hypothetical protein
LQSFSGVDAVSALIDVNKLRQRTSFRNRLSRGNKRIWNCDHGVARLNAGRHQCEAQRIGSTADSDTVFLPHKLREIALQQLHR